MGERSNIRIEDGENPPLYFYSHWDPRENLAIKLAEALDSETGRGRWGDGSYLARIIFSRMIRDDVDGETGYGISSYQSDSGSPDIVADLAQLTVDGLSFDEFISRTLRK